jgi:hypothetical protein
MKVCLLLGIFEEPPEVDIKTADPRCGVFTWVVADISDLTMGFFLAGVLN